MNRAIPLALVLLFVLSATAVSAPVAPVYVLHIDGEIDPAMAGYIRSGITDAENAAAQAVLVTMNTPGGLMSSMEDIISAFYSSTIPVIVFVSPENARAASAGAYIAMAADIAAMVSGPTRDLVNGASPKFSTITASTPPR